MIKISKYIKLLTLLLMTIALGGCSLMDNLTDHNTETISPTISVTNPPIITEVPTSTPTPTVMITPTNTPVPTVAPSPTTTPSPTPNVQSSSDKIDNILKDMTLEEKVGQLFFVRLKKEQAIKDITSYYLGGYILFGDDFKNETKDSIKKLTKQYQNASNIPLLIGVDEEGGTVNRVSKYTAFRKVPFHSPIELYKEGGLDLIKSDTLEKATLLLSLGINVNLAPVCDISTDSSDFIYARSFGKGAKETAQYVKTVVSQMKESKIGSTLKHFPGYGNNVDTHTGIAIDERSYDTFESSDFIPFEAGISAGADSILVSHNIVKCMDPNYPASLSKDVHDIIRNELNFNGVIMTDDLSMDAIKEYTGDKEAAVTAILAGNDLLIATNYEEQIPAVLDAIKNKQISEKRLDESVKRVLNWKLNLGILN